jgi:hypothetical protein
MMPNCSSSRVLVLMLPRHDLQPLRQHREAERPALQHEQRHQAAGNARQAIGLRDHAHALDELFPPPAPKCCSWHSGTGFWCVQSRLNEPNA